MTRSLSAGAALLLAVSCATAPTTRPNAREWNAIVVRFNALEAQRQALPAPSPNASRREQLEVRLATLRKVEASYTLFLDTLREYYERTGDSRAASLYAVEKIRLGDDYAMLLSRYDRAIEMYQNALALDPSNQQARERLERAEAVRFVRLESFSTIRNGMKEEEVRQILGRPREDWIKQIVQRNKLYSVWIYPKEDGGASAVYFDQGIVYFVNWNAAAAGKPAG